MLPVLFFAPAPRPVAKWKRQSLRQKWSRGQVETRLANLPPCLIGMEACVQRTGVINQIRAFLLERGIAVRQGLRSLRSELPGILATRTDVLSPRMLRIIEDQAGDWRRLDERIGGLSSEIETLARQDKACERLMTVPGIDPIITGHLGHQCSHAPGRPNLHLVSSSRRPRQINRIIWLRHRGLLIFRALLPLAWNRNQADWFAA
jgi:transposase